MRNTVLSEKDTRMIENAILKGRRILGIQELLAIFKEEYSTNAAYKRIGLLSKAGWLIRIKRGLYLVIDSIASRTQIDVSLLNVANTLVRESYVSFAHALNYYQMFDQYSNVVVSVTNKENKRFVVDNYTFIFSKFKQDMYFGFSEKNDTGEIVRIADAEKALIDYLYLDRSFGSASLVFEKIRDYHQDLDLKKLQEYALRSGVTIQRKIGFLLDKLNFDASVLYNSTKSNRGVSYFTKESKLFNAKWRIYYDHNIIR